MNDHSKKSKPGDKPDKLYREYQETRDNIPQSIYSELSTQAEQNRHEDNIHAIVQQAKVYKPEAADTKQQSGTPWLQKLFSAGSRPAWGMAFASLALAVVVLPLMNNPSGDYNAQIAHLADCEGCAGYVADASVVTRSVTPGLQRNDQRLRLAAKLGRIDSSLKLSVILEDQEIFSSALRELRKIADSTQTPELVKALESRNPNAATLIKAINSDIQSAGTEDIFAAAGEIHIANITARFALNESAGSGVHPTYTRAVEAFSAIREPTVLQQTILEQLQNLQSSGTLDDESNLKKSIELYRRAMESLGI